MTSTVLKTLLNTSHYHHVMNIFRCPLSCWSGFAAPRPGWRTELQRRPWLRCRGSWRTSETTGASTSRPRCKRSVSWKSTSTHCRPSCASAIGPPSCPLRGRWSLWVNSPHSHSVTCTVFISRLSGSLCVDWRLPLIGPSFGELAAFSSQGRPCMSTTWIFTHDNYH